MIGMRRPVGALGCLAVAIAGVVLFACFVVAPNVVVVGGVCWWILRNRIPDRLLAAAVAVLWAGPAWLLWHAPEHPGPLWWTPRAGWPIRWQTPEDGVAWVLSGLIFGPFLGASLWLLTQHRREHSPYAGADETEARMRQEERRYRWTVQHAHRLTWTHPSPAVRRVASWFLIPLGDQQGPYLGRLTRGDLGRGESSSWRAGPGTSGSPTKKLLNGCPMRLRL